MWDLDQFYRCGLGMSAKICVKGLYWEPQAGNPKNVVGIYLNIRTLVGICLLYIPTIFLGFPVWVF